MLELLRCLVFPRACIGCDRDDVLLCATCAQTVGDRKTIVLGGLEMRSCVPYAGLVRAAINELKRGRRAIAGDLASLVEPHVQAGTCLVPVPTTRRRRAQRGFDQTFVLAGLLAKRCGVGVAELLGRCGNESQQGRSRVERLTASGRFFVRPRAASRGTLVLFDDVRTTGATLVDAARTLREGGWPVAHALTLAWTPHAGE